MTVSAKNRTPWSEDEVAQLEMMIAQRGELREIACQLGRSEKAIEAKIYALRPKGTGPKAGKRQERRSNGALFFLS